MHQDNQFVLHLSFVVLSSRTIFEKQKNVLLATFNLFNLNRTIFTNLKFVLLATFILYFYRTNYTLTISQFYIRVSLFYKIEQSSQNKNLFYLRLSFFSSINSILLQLSLIYYYCCKQNKVYQDNQFVLHYSFIVLLNRTIFTKS